MHWGNGMLEYRLIFAERVSVRVTENFEVWPEAIELGRLFAERHYELALVGGPVRDMLLHRVSHDLDFCTSARPEEFEPILRRWGHDGFWDMGRKFGSWELCVDVLMVQK